MSSTSVETQDAPQAIGPYAQAVIENGWLFTSGQIGLDPNTGDLVGPGIEEQTERVLANLRAVLAAAGSTPERVLKATIFLTNLEDFKTVNGIYAGFFQGHKPARSTVQVAALPRGARIEIDLVATCG